MVADFGKRFSCPAPMMQLRARGFAPVTARDGKGPTGWANVDIEAILRDINTDEAR
jgi:hypothetical protein